MIQLSYMPKYNEARHTKPLHRMLELYMRYKYVRMNFARELLPGGSQGIVRQHQLRREQNGLLEQPPQQRNFGNWRYSPRVHSLTDKGRALALACGIEPKVVTGNSLSLFFHAMMICDTLQSIEIGCRKEGIEFIPWGEIQDRMPDPENVKMPYDIHVDGTRYKGTLTADGMFGLRYPDGRERFFALEAERMNPGSRTDNTQTSFRKKAIGYHDILNKEEYIEQFGIPNLWVLVVAQTPAKTDTQVHTLERLFGKEDFVLFTDVPEQLAYVQAPEPFPDILTRPLRRAGKSDMALYTPTVSESA